MTAEATKNARTGRLMALVALAMLGLAFASVPLYRAFCQLTGFDGTPHALRARDQVVQLLQLAFGKRLPPARRRHLGAESMEESPNF